MVVGRLLGWALVAAALAALGWEIAGFVQSGEYRVLATGELWSRLGAAGGPALPAPWNAVAAAALRLPAWTAPGVAGVLLAFLFRRRPQPDARSAPNGTPS